MRPPEFRYHPDPLRTGVVKRSNVACVCCGRSRGFIYTASVYSTHDLNGKLCPWCIANGSAATKFDASFNDDQPLLQKGIAEPIVSEVAYRTPGYVSWQQESWLSHCNDACEFHGDASVTEVATASAETKKEWFAEYNLSEVEWREITSRYAPGGDPAMYKFVCRHCGRTLFGWDCS